ncbi:MAG: hypothetical protein Q8P82_02435, partial [bacterium]|nr:hypothetical protein [bacterium]
KRKGGKKGRKAQTARPERPAVEAPAFRPDEEQAGYLDLVDDVAVVAKDGKPFGASAAVDEAGNLPLEEVIDPALLGAALTQGDSGTPSEVSTAN